MKYEETLKEIKTTFGFVPDFFKKTPKDVMIQMWPIFKKYQLGESAIPQKYREMMMLAAAAAVKCPYCEMYHREASKMLGATEEELSELAVLVASVGFWSNSLHTMNYDITKFAKELKKAGKHMESKSKSK
jgi:AhpD family alkylhydroperoxidase